VVNKKGFLLFELMVFISVISFFIMSFFIFEVNFLKTSKNIKQQQEQIKLLKNDYYLAMTAKVDELIILPKYFVETIDSNNYKIKVISDNVFADLFVIRKK